MDADAAEAGRRLYEERMAFLPGLWMPEAPDWNSLPEEDRLRWIGYAAESDGPDPGGSADPED